MFKIIFKYLLLPLGIIGTLFLMVIYFQNGNTLIITMKNDSNKNLSPQIYYSDKSHVYSEINSYSNFKVTKNKYYFNFPKLKNISYLRLDPAQKKYHILIENIMLVQSNWFSKTYYTLPLSKLSPLHQVTLDIDNNKNILSLQTTGNDPYLEMSFMPIKVNTVQDLHIITFLSLVLIAILLFFIYYIYKNFEHTNYLYAKVILYTLFFMLMLFKVTYYKDHVKFAYPPDELAHLSYIQYVHTHPIELIPTFKNMVMINNKRAGNYLSHPSLYYQLVNLVYDTNKTIVDNVEKFRTFSILVYIMGFILILYLAFSNSMGIIAHFVFLSFITSVPMHAYIGASISNDTLAMLGAVIFIIGFKRLLKENYSTNTYLILGIGILIAYFSKLTVALLIFFTLVFYLVYMIYTKKWIRINFFQISILFFILAPILIYQGYIMLHYHTIIPTFDVTHPSEYLNSPFFVPEQYRQHLTLPQWFMRIIHYIDGGWFGIHSHHSFTKNSWIDFFGLLFLHIIAITTLFLKCPTDNKVYCLIGKITLLSLFTVLIVQFFFSYKTHLHSGYMGGLQPRYLLPFMFSFAIMSSIFVERYKKIFIFNIIIIFISIHALYSDIFYFLKYYA